MARRLPSLNQLRAFEAAARHLSFKDAADELNVTHAAVSHQIKALEEYLGCKLFHRLTRGVRLSEPGASYAPELTRAFDSIVEATSRLSEGAMRGVLKVSVAPFYGNRWLLPRLHRFHEQYPEIQVRPELEFNVIDLGKGDIDACLRYGLGPWRGLDAIALHEDRIGPVCSPMLVAGRELPLSAADIRQMPLAAAAGRDEDWADWFAAAGLPGRAVVPAVEYQNRALTLDFALSGNGVALADVQFSDTDIASGHLVRLHPLTIKRTRGMYLVYPKSGFPDPRIVAFGEWIREEVSGGADG